MAFFILKLQITSNEILSFFISSDDDDFFSIFNSKSFFCFLIDISFLVFGSSIDPLIFSFDFWIDLPIFIVDVSIDMAILISILSTSRLEHLIYQIVLVS
jgi:hypothetical protein